MDEIAIRSIEPEELEAFLRAVERAFHGQYREDDLERERMVAEPDRSFVALDGDEIVGTAAACTTELTVPGGALPASGITAVGVLPSHRRRGINTHLIGTLLDQAVERDESLVYLWASESPIYGRFGFGLASWCTEIDAAADRSAFVPEIGLTGRLRTVTRDRALGPMRPVYDAVAETRPGMIALDDRWWTLLWHERKRDEDEPRFFVLHEDDEGSIDGYAVYTVKHEWIHSVPTNELHVRDLIAMTPEATASLWRYLFDVDLVATVKAWDRPVDDELLWLAAEPRRLNARIADGLWLRVLDVATALSGRTYSGEGRLVFEVDDTFRPESSGCYSLSVDGGEATCERVDADADVVCSVAALGAAYLGGNSFSQLERAHQVRELTQGALARADAMFAWHPSPWFGFIY